MRLFPIATIGLTLMLLPLSASSAAPTTATTTASSAARRAGAADAQRVLQSAITMLSKEIEPALRAGADAPREQSDYFQQHPAADLPAQAVVAALRRSSGGDPRVAAYVKWQLLSGLPSALDPKMAAELLQAYRAAPAPLPRPGMDKDDRDELERLVRNAKEDDEERVTEQFAQRVAAVERDNLYILKYRDALFKRLPPGYDMVAAGFEDAIARINAGADAGEHTRAVCKAASEWAAGTAPPPQVEQMRSMSRAVAQLQKKKGQDFYSKVYFSKSSGKLQWSKSQESLAGIAQIEELREFLDDKIRNLPTPLKLKEER
ncbi:MAG: hypothetical protein WBD40_06885 [Tepidisphaeraceae bacterium]